MKLPFRPHNAQAQPQINITADQLLGVGSWVGLDAQVVMQDDAIEQLRGVCIRAWEKKSLQVGNNTLPLVLKNRDPQNHMLIL